MRLLARDSTGKLTVSEDLTDDDTIPPYAILSHTWQNGEEVTFEDIRKDKRNTSPKSGYRKIDFCLEQAHRDGWQHVWVDTCCICKRDAVETQRAINSMFKWYRDAEVCYVYLADVSTSSSESVDGWGPAFCASRWFTRGWTLQELLAPRELKFFSQEGLSLGDKLDLQHEIHEITRIPLTALRGQLLSSFDVDERMSWIEGRQTTYKEDRAYSLLGLFGIHNMTLHYNEGEEEAFARLRRKIEK